MIFTPTPLEGAFIVRPEPHEDERGSFARTFCAREFSQHGLVDVIDQVNCSSNTQRGTLRGLHYQTGDAAETRLVECIRGRIFDVIVDLRPDSVTFRDWFGIQLSAQAANMLYVPRHFAHGFQTLTDDCEIRYLVNGFYAPEAAAGLRWDDPVLGIEWPLDVSIMSDRDRVWPLLEII